MTETLVDLAAVHYRRGVMSGQMIAQLGDPLNIYRNATAMRGAAPYTLEQARANLTAWGHRPEVYEASGVLHGFKTATADRPDADVCSADDRRILLAVQDEMVVTCRSHGTFCDADCADKVCDQGCVLRDDRSDGPPRWWQEQPEPEWDRDAYYEAKYPQDADL